jgi:replication-associated recombination protein RarA
MPLGSFFERAASDVDAETVRRVAAAGARGAGHVYAHDTEEGVGGLDCLPESLQGTRFYHPRERGFEAELGKRLAAFQALREQARKRDG